MVARESAGWYIFRFYWNWIGINLKIAPKKVTQVILSITAFMVVSLLILPLFGITSEHVDGRGGVLLIAVFLFFTLYLLMLLLLLPVFYFAKRIYFKEILKGFFYSTLILGITYLIFIWNELSH